MKLPGFGDIVAVADPMNVIPLLTLAATTDFCADFGEGFLSHVRQHGASYPRWQACTVTVAGLRDLLEQLQRQRQRATNSRKGHPLANSPQKLRSSGLLASFSVKLGTVCR
jgi:hypothetical protein